MRTDEAYKELVEAVKANRDKINSIVDLIQLQRDVIASMQERADKEERYARRYEADNVKLRELLKEVLEFHSAVMCSYANGVEAQGVDEGEYYGQKAEKELMDKITAALKGTGENG